MASDPTDNPKPWSIGDPIPTEADEAQEQSPTPAPKGWQPGDPITEADLGGQPDQAQEVPTVSALGHVTRTAVSELGPGAAAAAAFTPAFEAGTALGSETGPFAPLIGLAAGIGASTVAGAGAAWAQHKAAQMIAPEKTEEFNKELQAGEQQHPIAGAVGRIASALPMFELSPFESVKGVSAIYKAARGMALTAAEKMAARATAAQVGLGTGQSVVQPLLFGDSPTKQGIAEAFVQSLILGHPRYGIFGAQAEKALTEEETAKDQQQAEQQSNTVENPANTYAAPPAAPALTPEQRAKLSVLAGKAAAGAPLSAEDAVTHRLMADNEAARKFFDQEKQTWANEKTRRLAAAAMERSDFGDAKIGQSDYAGGEMASQGGAEFPVETPAEPHAPDTTETIAPAPSESQPAENPTETPTGNSQPEAETQPTPAAPVPPSETSLVEQVVGSDRTKDAAKELAKGAASKVSKQLNKDEKPDWTKYQGEPEKFVDEFRDVVDSGKVNVAKGTTKMAAVTGEAYIENQIRAAAKLREDGKTEEANAVIAKLRDKFTKQEAVKVVEGLGQKRAAIYQDLAGLTPDKAKAEVEMDINATRSETKSRKRVAMLSPDGSHVVVGVASETVSNGKRTLKVSTHDIDAGRKSPKGHYASSYDKMVEQGWKPLASMKNDKALTGIFATYSPEQWSSIAAGLREIKGAAQRTTEAMMEHLEAVKEWGGLNRKEGSEAERSNLDRAQELEHLQEQSNLGKAAAPEEEVLADHTTLERAQAENMAARDEVPHFDQPHAEAIWDALDEHEPKSPEEAILALGKSNVFGAVEPLIHDLGLDPKKQTAREISGVVGKTIFEHYERARKEKAGGSAEGFTESILQESRGRVLDKGPSERPVSESVGTEPGRTGTPAGSEPGAGGTEARAEANAEGGAAGAAKPNTERAAAEPASHVEIADKDGLGPKETTKLQVIAERVAEARGHEGRNAIEEAADELMEQAVAVKVNGESALLVPEDGVIHTQDGKQLPIPSDLFADVAKQRRQQAVEEVNRLRPNDFKTASVAQAAIRGLRAVGIRVGVIIDPLAKHFGSGEYATLLNGKGNAVQVIRWHVADLHNPTTSNLVALFHEAGHAVFAKMPPEMQAALHRAIESFTNEQLHLGDFQEAIAKGVKPEDVPFVQQEGRLVEALAQKLVQERFNPAEAQSAAQRVWTAIKDVARGVYMAFQKMAGFPISNERAMAYFEHRMKQALRGEQPMSLLNFLGGSRMKLPDWDSTTRFSGINRVINPRLLLDTREGAPVGIAALNHFVGTVRELVHQWDTTGNTAGLSDEQITKFFVKLPEKVGDSDLFTNGVTPTNLIADAVKLHGVSPDTRIEDLPNDVARTTAATMSHAMYSAMKAEMTGAADVARREWKSNTYELERNQNTLTRLTKDYVDLDYMDDVARKTMLSLVSELKTTVRGIRDVAAKEGELGQVIQQLDGALKNGADLPAPYRKALDEVHTLLTHPETGSDFADTLQRVASMDIDWKKAKAKDIAEGLRQLYQTTRDPHLLSLTGDTDKARALMATTIAFGKSNSHMMDLLALRAEKAGDERAKANALLKDMLNVSRGSLGELAQRINLTFDKNIRLRELMLRTADKFKQLKERNYELSDAIARNQATVDFHEDVFTPVAEQKMAELEKMVGIQLKAFEVYHNAKVPVPDHAGAAPDKFTEKVLKLRSDIGKRGERPSPSPEVVSWMKLMEDWTRNQNNTRFGAKYNEVVDALNKLKNHYVTDQHLNLKGSFATRLMGPIQERCNEAGTPLSRLNGQAFNRFSSLLRAKVREVVQKGTNFSAVLNEARQACGYPATSEKIFWDNVVAPALHELEQNGEKYWAHATNVGEMVNQAMTHALDYMDDAGNLPSGKARTAVKKLLRQHVANADMLVKNGAELGLKVLDEEGNYKIFRPVRGVAPFVMPRVLSDIAQDHYREHMGAWGGDSIKAAKVAEAYEQDPNALRLSLKDRFTQPVWDWFMKSLAYNDRSHFRAPSEGGIAPLASRENVIAAYERAHGDVVSFAEELARLHGHKPDGAFVGDTLDTIQNFHNLLRTMVGDEGEAVRGGSPAPRRFIVDARHVQAAPKEWLEYLMSDQYQMEKVIHAQAFHAAFGRNGAAMDHNLDTAINEQQLAANKYEAWRSAMLKEEPSLTEKKLQQQIKERCEQEGISYTSLKQARTNLATLRGVAKDFAALKSINNSGKIPELQPWARLVRTIGGWTVSGAGTAITAHSVFLEQPSRLFGLNGRSLAMTAQSVVDLGKVMANSILQTFGRECAFESDRMLNANEAGLFDPINTNQQRLVTAWNHAHAAYRESGAVGKTVGKLADIGGAALQTDVFAPGAREKALARQANGQAVAPTAKVFSPFHWIAECLQISNFITWQRHIEGMVAAGVRHLVEHHELVDDPNLKFTGSNGKVQSRFERSGDTVVDFGAGDREFRFLTQRMADFGFSLEQLTRDAYKNRGTDKPMLSDEVNKAIQQLVLNEITLESSLTSRMPALQTNGLGVAMNPFLGWPLQKTYQVFRQLREPNGEATAKALRTGLTAYMAILPIGMAVSWLRNKFDEEMLGRKQNVSDLGTIHDVPSGLLTALDNASRVGTFGFIGEGANYFLNDDNSRPVTLDNRIFFVNTIENTFNAARALYHQTLPQLASGNFEGAAKTATDYQTVVRPLFQTLGGNGLLQNLGAINHLLSLDDAEARVSNRISVNNYLRVAGRELNLDVRTFGGMLQNSSTPSPIKPFVGQMVLAAYANDHDGFNAALRDAVQQARQDGLNPQEAMKKVVSMFEGQNPLRIVFKSPPTETEYRQLLAQLPDNGKQSVAQALTLYQHYAQQIGAKADAFGKDKQHQGQGPAVLKDEVASSLFNRMRGSGMTLDNMRRGTVGLGW